MLRLLTPDAHVARVTDVSLQLLRSWGVRGVALDLDNTIVPWHTEDLAPHIAAWVGELRAAGISFCLVTNNYSGTGQRVADALGGMPVVRAAMKPNPFAFGRALQRLGVPAREAVVVGDQLFTDVLGGKLVGTRAVYVEPIAQRAFITTKLMRLLERPLLARTLRRA